MSEYVSCEHCANKKCERYGGSYGYTFCDNYVKKAATNADKLRTMPDGDLARFLLDIVITDAIPFCRCLPECEEDMDADRPIPDSRCLECMEHWLGTEAEQWEP